jgi:hypothetical protein
MKKNYLLCLLLLAFKISNSQTTVTITADKDNTIFANSNTLSNGAGTDFFAGVTGPQGGVRRALIHFNLSSIPPRSTITSATLTLSADKQSGAGGVSFYRVSKDWGEGTSDAPSGEGKGAAATVGDATWNNAFYPSTTWTNAGGDFSATPTATVSSVTLGAGGVVVSGANLVSDVQSFVNNSTTNFGWIIVGTNESATNNAQRFVSRNSSNTAAAPKLTVTYTSSLPVTLKQFSGSLQNSNALLQWQTLTEINNQYFAIQHSTDGVNFSQIARVNGNGNSTGMNSYSYTVANVAAGKHYYRIAQFDFDGNVHYSQVIVLAANSKSLLEFYPNPVISSIRLLTSRSLDGASFNITSVNGQTVKKGILNAQQIKVDELSPGQYWLTIRTDNGEQFKSSFIKR